MPLPRRPVSSQEQAAVAARVRGLLTPVRGGWTLPPGSEQGGTTASEPSPPGPEPADPAEEETSSGLASGPAAPPAVAPAAADEPPAPVPTVLERLRTGRLDPGRRAVAGLALLGLLACLLAGALLLRSQPEEVAAPVVEQPGTPISGATLPSAQPPAAEVVVAVAGRVRRPGLVRLAPGSRVDDALRAAGGLSPGATVGLLNLARRVVDGEQVLVGVEAPPGQQAPPGPAAGTAAASGRVDLNTATASGLDALPGIGPVLAQRIVDHRTQNGPFRSVDQLREVSGIGEAKYGVLRELVTV